MLVTYRKSSAPLPSSFFELRPAARTERICAGLRGPGVKASAWAAPPIAPALEKRIREGLATPGPVRKIAARFGVNPGTVQRISRPFVAPSVVAVVA